MEKKDFLEALKKLKENSKKRNFSQAVDIVINLREIDIKREDRKIDHFVNLPFERGKKIKACALVDKQLLKNAQENCDLAILNEEFPRFGKKEIKKIANDHNFFIAQANIMTEVAKYFGKVLGPRGKMPNPKAGCVVPGTADLKPVVQRLQKTARLITKNEASVKALVGFENGKDEEIAENCLFIYNSIIDDLPEGKNNIKSVILKFTMGKPYEIGKGFRHESTAVEKTGS